MVSFVPVTIFVLNVIQPDVQLRDIMDLSCQKTSQNQDPVTLLVVAPHYMSLSCKVWKA